MVKGAFTRARNFPPPISRDLRIEFLRQRMHLDESWSISRGGDEHSTQAACVELAKTEWAGTGRRSLSGDYFITKSKLVIFIILNKIWFIKVYYKPLRHGAKDWAIIAIVAITEGASTAYRASIAATGDQAVTIRSATLEPAFYILFSTRKRY
ncbi:uncharacterized protein NECHADRAFT_89161 [Fusarium vanettenii 77-13-4]|uniref:Uncharacterized protein n=1 Tax=Fusarium vanettenii (strain ATCC MYA-4622 / CBS 123669 / FGSC 9596 / NRRL 45880 / 77-13-4) TaxID=660122 RepID=C7ZQE5_FUSV7|nr:uncharacterized protein NECHADRAFT_89161 [Fusarium vanettenii 77-13-4]EEU33765.1 predicted protein [Fusarium vanettenii 77-13-4]